MARYISAEKAKEILIKNFPECRNCAEEIDLVPAEDVEPVIHAHWIPYNCADPKWLRDDGKSVFMTCSHCEQAVARNFCGKANYCPYCGAKMEE